MVSILLVLAVKVSYFAGYMRRASKLRQALAQDGISSGGSSSGKLLIRGLADGRIEVRVDFGMPSIVDGVEFRRCAVMTAPGESLGPLAVAILEHNARHREVGAKED